VLTADGFAVKLNHDDVETSWEKHGYVELSLGDAKVRSELYQHNRNFHKRGDEAYALLKELNAVLDSAWAAAAAEAEPELVCKEPALVKEASAASA
jgi:hypothetical protein